MELTLITDQWNPRGGGRERYLAEFAAWAISRGDGVHVHCLQDRSENVPPMPTTITTAGRRGPGAERRLDEAVRRMRTAFPDRPVFTARPQVGATHYQLHSGIYRDAFEAERQSLDSALRRLLFWPALRLNRHRVAQLEAERHVFDATSHTRFMTFSTTDAEKLSGDYAIAAARIAVARPGVDPTQFHPLEKPAAPPAPPEGGLRLLFAGHNFVLKGLKTAIMATARCRRDGVDASLTVAGGGPVSRFRGIAARAGVGNHVRFLGPIEQDALAALYQRSHLLIHPSFFDPFPRVIVEAFASGCAVVTTRRCGVAELMTDGLHGRLVEEPDDVDAFASACCSFADRRAWRRAREAGIALGRLLSFDVHASCVRSWLEN